MGSLKDEAKDYTQPSKLKNISDLPQCSTDFELMEGKGVDKDGNEFVYKYVSVNGENYRVPGVVLGQIKDILEDVPDLKAFKVKRSGEGKTGTRYTVVQLTGEAA